MQHDLIEYQIMIEKKIEKDNKKKNRKSTKRDKKEKKDKREKKEKKDKKEKKKKDKKEKQPEELDPPESIHSSVDGRIIRWSKRQFDYGADSVEDSVFVEKFKI